MNEINALKTLANLANMKILICLRDSRFYKLVFYM